MHAKMGQLGAQVDPSQRPVDQRGGAEYSSYYWVRIKREPDRSQDGAGEAYAAVATTGAATGAAATFYTKRQPLVLVVVTAAR